MKQIQRLAVADLVYLFKDLAESLRLVLMVTRWLL